jgi:hypothetical protein
MKDKKRIVAFIYKLFMIVLILSQIYLLIFPVVNLFTILTNLVLIVYLSFRFYLLHKLCENTNKINKSVIRLIETYCEGCDKESE